MRSRMFKLWLDKRIKTWNPFVGCYFDCSYCWARKMARRSRCEMCRAFIPHFHLERIPRIPRSGIIFVGSMGDLACFADHSYEARKVMEAIIEVQKRHDAIFFFETKDPWIYLFVEEFAWIDYGDKTIISTTIETNRDQVCKKISKAPPPSSRYKAMLRLKSWYKRRHISIEPIMDFDPNVMFKWITEIEPEIVSIGYDNYNNHLPEPPLSKTLKLIEDLEASGIMVERKTLRESKR